MKINQIISQVPPDLSVFREDHAIAMSSSLPDFNPRYAKVIGTMDGKDVWITRFFGEEYNTFAFREGEDLLAYIVIGRDKIDDAFPLVRIWSSGQITGAITTLVRFVLSKLQLKLIITDDEPLTKQGWNWLIRATERGKLKAYNATTREQLFGDDLRKDRASGFKTDLAVIIESDKSKYPLYGTGYRILGEPIYTLGDKNLE